jgi:hypothetical protein
MPEDCANCGYCLKGILSDRCPECGKRIESYSAPRILSERMILIIFAITVAIAGWYVLGAAASQSVAFSATQVTMGEAIGAITNVPFSSFHVTAQDIAFVLSCLVLPVALHWASRYKLLLCATVLAGMIMSLVVVGDLGRWTMSLLLAMLGTPITIMGGSVGEDWAEEWIKFQAIGWWIALCVVLLARLGLSDLSSIRPSGSPRTLRR